MEYYIWWDAEYAQSDRDELLGVAKTDEEIDDIIEKWAANKAQKTGIGPDHFVNVKDAFKKQVCITTKNRYAM